MPGKIPIFLTRGEFAPRRGVKWDIDPGILAIVYDPSTGKYLGLQWKQVPWETFVSGGIEVSEGQTAEEAARAEVRQETGYVNIRLVRVLPQLIALFYHPPKLVNRAPLVTPFLFELVDDTQVPISQQEIDRHEYLWLTPEELRSFRLPEPQRHIANYLGL